MDEDKIPYTDHSAGESPIPIPPVGDAWALMKQKLDEDMPVALPWYYWFTRPGSWVLLVFICGLTGLGIWVMGSRRIGGGTTRVVRLQGNAGVIESAQGVEGRKGNGDSAGGAGAARAQGGPANVGDTAGSAHVGAAGSSEIKEGKAATAAMSAGHGKDGGNAASRHRRNGNGIAAAGRHATWGNGTALNGKHATWGNKAGRKGRHARWGNGTADKNGTHAVWGNGAADGNRKHAKWGNETAMEKKGRNRTISSDEAQQETGNREKTTPVKNGGNKPGVRVSPGMGLAGTGLATSSTARSGSGTTSKYISFADSLLRAMRNNRKLPEMPGNNMAANLASTLAKNLADKKALADKIKKERKRKDRLRDSSGLSMSAGLYLSQYFRAGPKDSAAYTFSNKGSISMILNYIPSSYFRLHLRDGIYLQTSLQLISPQQVRTRPIDSTGRDSSHIPGYSSFLQRTDLTLTKLYYTKIPVSVHFRIFKGLYLGAGIQYARLWDASGFKTITLSPINGGRDTIYSQKVVGLKNDTVGYKKLSSSEWRALFEADYQWRRFTFGFRYEKAFKPYLSTQLNGTKGMDKNSSFSLHLYYELWERSSKKH